MKKALLILPLLLLMTACSDNDLKKVASGLNMAAKTINIVQTTVIDANMQGLLAENETRKILEVCQTLNQAGKDSVKIIRTLEKLSPEDKAVLAKILLPAFQSLHSMLDNGMLFIKNEQTRIKIRTLLLAEETALNSVIIALAVT
jgi:hypothetical protein